MLTTQRDVYTIAKGGISEAIIIDLENCFPVQDLRIEIKGVQLINLMPNPQSIKYYDDGQT